MVRLLALITLLLATAPSLGDDRALLERALAGATAQFEQALPLLRGEEMGVDVQAYREALIRRQFSSTYWNGTVGLDLEIGRASDSACGRFAAYVRIPPANGRVGLVACPRFFTPGADALRVLTILHEMAHVVAGPDECRAMAFAALVQDLSTGTFTPVDTYWEANGCRQSRYSLPSAR